MEIPLAMLAGKAAQFLAEVLISSLVETTISARIKQWRVQNAIRRAIEAAFTATITTYPGFDEAVTDTEYLSREGVRIQLQKLVHPTEMPNLEVLVQEWHKHFPVQMHGDVRLVLSRLLSAIERNLRAVEEVSELLHQKESTGFITSTTDMLVGIRSDTNYLVTLAVKESADDTSKQFDAQIDVCEQLRGKGRTIAAREQLLSLEAQARTAGASSKTLFRIITNLAACALELGDDEEGIRRITAAYDLVPTSRKAQANLAFARLMQGRIDEAVSLADEVLAGEPTGTAARAVRVQALAKLKDYKNLAELVEEQFLDDAKYVIALGFVFARGLDYDRAVMYLRRAIALDENDFESRLLLAKVIVDKHGSNEQRIVFQPATKQTGLPQQALSDASQLLDEALKLAQSGDNPGRKHQALAARSGLRAMAGDLVGAKADADAILWEDQHHATALRHRMLIAIEEDKFDEAVQFFEKLPNEEKAVAENALPAAGAYLEVGKPDVALRLASPLCGNSEVPSTPCAILMAHALAALDRPEEALTIRNRLLERSARDPHTLETVAFIDHLVGNTEGMLANLKAAAELATGEVRRSIYLRLAQWHLAHQQFEESVEHFELSGSPEAMAPEQARAYTIALYKAQQYGNAYEACRRLREAGIVDPTLISIEAWIAEHVGDITAASMLHGRLSELQPQQLRHKVNKARAVFRLGKKSETRAILDSIDVALLADAIDLMEVAELYAFMNAPAVALQLAYRALRIGYTIPDIHLAYVTLFLRCAEDIDDIDPGSVGGDTVVRVGSGAETRWIAILETVHPDVMRGEFSLDSEPARRLLGRRVGDRVIFKASALEELNYEVLEIQSIYVRAFQNTLDEFATLFPTHQGLHKIRVVNSDFTKFFTVVAGQSEFAQNLYQFYHEGALTLEQLAWLLGRSQVDVQQSLAGLGDHRLLVSTGSAQDQAIQAATIEAAADMTIGMSSLVTLGLLNLLGAICLRFQQVYVPQQVIDELDRVIMERELSAKRGGRTIGYDDGRFYLEEVPPERVREGIDKIVAIRDFARESFTVTSVSSEYADRLRAADVEIHTVGAVSLATVLVAKQTKSPLGSDDLRLRRYALSQYGVPSFWSQPLLENLRRRGLMDDTALFEAIAELASAHYYYSAVSAELLEWAVERHSYRIGRRLVSLFDVLAGPDTTENTAVGIAGQVLRKIWLAPILPDQKRALLHMILAVLSRGRVPAIVLQKLNGVLEARLALLPLHLSEIRGEIAAWRRIVAPAVMRPGLRRLT